MLLGRDRLGAPEMSQRWIVLIALTLARTTMAFQFQLVAALSPVFLDRLGLGFVEFGALAGAYLLPGVVAALLGGWLGTRVGDIRTALMGLVLMIAGGLAGVLATGFEGQMAARMVAGAGAVALNVMVTKMAGDWFQGRKDLPAAMGTLIASWPAGIALAMLVLPGFLAAFGATAALLSAPVLAALALAFLATVWRAPDTTATSVGPASRPGLNRGELWLIFVSGALWALYNVAFINVLAWMPQALIPAGQTVASATALVSLIGWVAVVSVPAGGMLAATLGSRNVLALLSLAGAGAMAFGFGVLGSGAYAALYMIALGLIMGPAAALIMSLPIEATRREVRSIGMGLFLALYYALMGIAPSLMGALLEATGDETAPIRAAGWLLWSCIGFWALFRASQARIAAAGPS